MSDNSDQTQTQSEANPSGEQMVGLVPLQTEDHNIGVQLIGTETDEDFFGAQAIELNGERHVIVSQAQDPETGELLLVLRGENGEHIAIQSEALSSMVQASGGEQIQVAVVSQTDETALTLSSDISSLTQSTSTCDVNPMTTSLTALPSIIANIPSQTQISTASTNVVQAIDTPRVSQEEQPSITTVLSSQGLTPQTDQIPEAPVVSVLPKEDITKDNESEVLAQEVVKEVEEKSPKAEDIDNKSESQKTDTKSPEMPQKSETNENKETEVSEPIETQPKATETPKVDEIKDISDKESNDLKANEITSNSEVIENTTNSTESVDKTITTITTTAMETKTTTSEPMVTSCEPTVTSSESTLTLVEPTVVSVEPTVSSSEVKASTSETLISSSETNATTSESLVSSGESMVTSGESLVTSGVALISSSEPTVSSVETPNHSVEPTVNTETSTVETTADLGFGNTAVIQVQDSGNPIEQLMANAVMTADGNFVLMAQTEDGQVTGLPSDLNLSDVINAGGAGQTFLIETPEGLVACTASTSGEDGAIQLIPTESGDIETQSSGNLVENQLIQAISGGQAMSYTFNSSSGCLELTAVDTPTTQSQVSAPKPSRSRGQRTPKSKTISSVPSMGQTLLLSNETSVMDSPIVTTKPSTPARNRGGRGRGGRGGGAYHSSINSNTEAMKGNPKNSLSTTDSKTNSSVVNNLSTTAIDSQSVSQLAASRRTYSKKSNIVWITPDASQGPNTTPFATVATASPIPSSPSKAMTGNTSPTKSTPQSTTRVRTPSPTKTIASTAPQMPTKPSVPTITSSKPIDKTTVETISANKMTTPLTTTTQSVTASKTSVKMTTPSPKVQTPNLSIKTTTNSKTETMTKTQIRVSDITATKTSVTTPSLKSNVSKPVVTDSSVSKTRNSSKSAAKSTTSAIPPTKSVVSTPSSNKTSVPSTTTSKSLSTVVTTSETKPINTTSDIKSTPTLVSSTAKTSKSLVSTTRSSAKSNATKTLSEKEKLLDKVEEPFVSTPVSLKSNTSSVKESKTTTTGSSDKTVLLQKSSEKTTSGRSVETRHSSRLLSPSKANKSETISQMSKELVAKTPTDSEKSTEKSIKEQKEDSNKKSILENELKSRSKADTSVTEVSSVTTPKSSDKSAIETQKKESVESTISVRKSRRNSKNNTNIEIKKDVKNTEMETKTKEISLTEKSMEKTETPKEKIETPKEKSEKQKEKTEKSKEKEKLKEKPKEKTETPKEKTEDFNERAETKKDEKMIETPVESVSTRRTSSRKRESINPIVTKNDISESLPTTPTVEVTPIVTEVQQTSGRVTRASSVKKPEPKPTKAEEKESKTDKTVEKEIETKEEGKREALDFDKIMEMTKPSRIESTPQTAKAVVTNTSEPIVGTRSVKKRVQFESSVKDKSEDISVDKNEDKESKEKETKDKTPEVSVSTLKRRSLRSSTPQTTDKTKSDDESNKSDVSETEVMKTQTESNDKTPQRFSTRKRKEVIKSVEPEVKPTKSPKKSPKSDRNPIETINSWDSPSTTRFRDRKSKYTKPFERRVSNEMTRHSIETSEPLFRNNNRSKSLIQSYIDENEWQEKEDSLRRHTISSLSDLRSPNECYDYSTNECSFYIRHQSTSLTPKQSAGNYLCQKCGFHTTRINNLVIHHRDQCSYIKNAVIQQWQTELQKRVRPSDPIASNSSSMSNSKRRKVDNTDESNNSLDDSDDDSEEERNEDNIKSIDKNNPTISDIDAMLMADDDDEDLLSIDNNSVINDNKREFGFAEDDIVWVDTNGTHWPALVSKIFPKEKKALVKLIDSPWTKKSLKTSVNTIASYDCAEVNKKYVTDGRKGSNGEALVKAVQKAEEFLRKKFLGNELSAAKFFDQMDSDLSEANVDVDERINVITNEDISDNKITSKTSTESVAETSLPTTGTNGSNSEEDTLPESNEAIAQWKEKRRQQNAKLLQCIKEGKVETHLLGVYRENISSERHLKFRSGSESEKNQLKHVPWFGPIDDEEQQEEIYDYCSQLFKTNFKTDGSFDTVAYIFEVWVPEAIVKAIARVRRIELKDSEVVFAKGVILSKSEKDELNKEIQKEAEKQMTSQTSSE